MQSRINASNTAMAPAPYNIAHHVPQKTFKPNSIGVTAKINLNENHTVILQFNNRRTTKIQCEACFSSIIIKTKTSNSHKPLHYPLKTYPTALQPTHNQPYVNHQIIRTTRKVIESHYSILVSTAQHIHIQYYTINHTSLAHVTINYNTLDSCNALSVPISQGNKQPTQITAKFKSTVTHNPRTHSVQINNNLTTLTTQKYTPKPTYSGTSNCHKYYTNLTCIIHQQPK
eukprot:gene3047-2029_t